MQPQPLVMISMPLSITSNIMTTHDRIKARPVNTDIGPINVPAAVADRIRELEAIVEKLEGIVDDAAQHICQPCCGDNGRPCAPCQAYGYMKPIYAKRAAEDAAK